MRRFQKSLLDWYGRHKRRLPWRSDPSPYRVWVSEIMLQQTQVNTVLPYYERFLARFPDIRTLAAASEEEVLAHWAGLGYYRRARNMHRAAEMIVHELTGEFPEKLEEILKLPGIGRYTAGAIHSIAFNQPQPIVDGNVRRVIIRLHAIRVQPSKEFLWHQATAWTARDRPSDFNQAVMELGALVCTPIDPRCAACPVAALCAASKLGIQARIPAARELRTTEAVALVTLVLEHKDSVLLCQNIPAPYIPGSWGLPARLLRPAESPEKAVRTLSRSIRVGGISSCKIATVRHSITHHRIVAHVFRAQIADNVDPSPGSGFRWVTRAEVDRFLTSSLFRKALKAHSSRAVA